VLARSGSLPPRAIRRGFAAIPVRPALWAGWPAAWRLALAALLPLALAAGCARPAWTLDPAAIAYDRGGFGVALADGHPLRALALLDGTGALLLEQPVPPGQALRVRFDYPWRPGEGLSLRAIPATGSPAAPGGVYPLGLPATRPPPLAVSLQLPPGVDTSPGEPLILPAGAVGTLALSLRNAADHPLAFTLRVRLAGVLQATAAPPGPVYRLLPGQGDLALLPFRVTDSGPGAVTWEVLGLGPPLRGEGSVTARPAAELAAGLLLAESVYPADEQGAARPDLPLETLTLAPALSALPPRDPFRPVGHARLVVASRLPGAAVALVRSWVEPGPGGAAVGGFGDPLRAPGAEWIALAHVPPGGRAVLAQPVYLDERHVAPGEYRRCTVVEPWGLPITPPPRCTAFRVLASPLWGWIALALLTAAAALAFAFALLRLPRSLARMPLRDQVLTTLFFGLAVVVVSLPFLPVNAVAGLLLGPLTFLVEGLFYKLLLFALLGCLFALLPRPGVYLLFYSLWMVAQALLSGHYAPSVLLFAGVAVTVMEAALWLSGLTRGRAAGAVLWPALAVGLGEALIVYWDLQLLRALYRQYLAEWYLLAQAVCAGLYAGAGLALGLPLGRSLAPLRRPAPPPPLAAPAGADPEESPSAPVLEVRDLHCGYPGAARPALRGVSLALAPGEIVLLAGASGAGKTTLLRCIQGLLPLDDPGAVRFRGRPRGGYTPPEWAARCALLFQEPALQVLRPTVAGEVSLGLELAGDARPDGLAQTLTRHGLAHLARRSTTRLSGGELQRTALASLLAGSPALLLLDEPLAHLDAVARAAFPARLRALAAQGVAILVAEHRLEFIAGCAHRTLTLHDGQLVPRAAPQAEGPVPLPSPARSGRQSGHPRGQPRRAGALGMGLRLDAVSFRHADADRPLFAAVTAQVPPGRAVLLTGANGAGKSTLLELLLGLRRPASGAVTLDGVPVGRLSWRQRSGAFGFLPQRSDLILHAPSVLEELCVGPLRQGRPAAQARALAQPWLERLGLSHAAGRFPHLLSRGERQRLALGAVLINAPRLLMLDEPFAGQDPASARAVLGLCHDFLAADPARSLLLATHDLELAGAAFDEVWRLEDGALLLPPRSAAPARNVSAGGTA